MPCIIFHKEIRINIEDTTYCFCYNCGKLYRFEDGLKKHIGFLSPEPSFYEDLCELQKFLEKLHEEFKGEI